MSEQKEPINDVWETIEDKEYVSFDMEKNNNVIEIQFIDNNFNPKISPQFGTLQYEFEVIESNDLDHIKTFSPSSNRLMRKLKEHRPLASKWFKIERFGEGFKTDYEIVEVKKTKQEEIPKK